MRGELSSRWSAGSEEKIFSFEDFEFRPARIKKIVNESRILKSFYLEDTGKVIPNSGQFVMVWLPGAEEVPMSVSDAGESFIRISVAEKGSTTAKLHKLKIGGTLFVRGPFGNGFSLEGRSFLIVAGGYGAAPLIYAAKILSRLKKRCTFLLGAKNKSELSFVDEARRTGAEVHVATDDGSSGHKGMVTDLVEPLLQKENFDSILACGPEPMLYWVAQEGVKRGFKVQVSLERYMKCGFGICGSCVLDPLGLRVCVDGPVFDARLLLKTEFGKQKRDAAGAKVMI